VVVSRRAGQVSRVIPVLLYHSVADEPSRDHRFAVSQSTFEAHADAIKASGRTSLRISELASGLRGEGPLPAGSVAITFDDGFADAYRAVQSLAGRGLSSTVYITPSEIGAPDRLTGSQVAELAHMPLVEIGAHALNHPYLDELHDGELTEEIQVSKSQLEDLAQVAVHSFAYPHGAYDTRVRGAVIRAGYSSAAAVKDAVSHAADDPFAIARWTVTWGTPASRIAQVLEGDKVPLAWSHERVRTRAYRTVRRSRRRLARALGAAL
jgi:peptidoglycan/xylan/chitin deacetylase (PgdA/CDA1 family)